VLRRVTPMLDSTRGRRPSGLGRSVPILFVMLALVSSACTLNRSSETDTTAPSPKVTELRSVTDLQERFDRDSGKVRLILLVSPT
jgi:hypothetical protein